MLLADPLYRAPRSPWLRERSSRCAVCRLTTPQNPGVERTSRGIRRLGIGRSLDRPNLKGVTPWVKQFSFMLKVTACLHEAGQLMTFGTAVPTAKPGRWRRLQPWRVCAAVGGRQCVSCGLGSSPEDGLRPESLKQLCRRSGRASRKPGTRTTPVFQVDRLVRGRGQFVATFRSSRCNIQVVEVKR